MQRPLEDDLQVHSTSDALLGRRIDVVVSGSIAAVESVRFIRSLRRLGATVTPWLTKGAAQFISPMALEWASANPCKQDFSGTASHICTSDAIVIAPASANMLNRLAKGYTDSPASALVASALGQGKQVLVLPAMHASLAHSPNHLQNIATLKSWAQVSIFEPRLEEGKEKFPEPVVLADQVAHAINSNSKPTSPVLITMGTNRGYIDDVRYISNYSSGKLGSLISEELYRNGFKTHVVSGPCEFQPKVFTKLVQTLTHQEMLQNCELAQQSNLSAAVFAASVLDFEPTQKQTGKIRSSQKDLTVTLKPTSKIIEKIKLSGKPKIGFKLETDLSLERAQQLAKDYCQKYELSALICNNLSAVSTTKHHAWAVSNTSQTAELPSKDAIAKWILNKIVESLGKV